MATEHEVERLYLAMTRPPLIFGVPMMYAGVCGVLCCLAFIWLRFLGPFFMLSMFALYPVLHAAGYWMVQKDPRFMEIFLTWGNKCARCQTRQLFGTNVYLGE